MFGEVLFLGTVFSSNCLAYMFRIIPFLFLMVLSCQTKNATMKDQSCDSETGVCAPADLSKAAASISVKKPTLEIIYVGDPMCSWCWGIAPSLKELKEHYKAENISFRIVAGGLRPGGGDTWDNDFKEFLKHHWEEVHERSGQPFGYKLFKKDNFNYDTEPSCRAVVTAAEFKGIDPLSFFEAVQHKFYVENEDPNEVGFYESICKKFEIDFQLFKSLFLSEGMKIKTNKEFVMNREWGVRGYPCVLLKKDTTLHPVTYGYATFEEMKKEVENIRSK